VASTASELIDTWHGVQQSVRGLHERLFYRPLLSAVASLPEEGFALTSEQAEARLAAIGFLDPGGALRHIAALTGGVSRRAAIQRALLPVMLQWRAEGADPDYGLLAFRRLSEDLGETHWFLRMLRDSSGVAERLTHVLSGSRYIGGLFERIPEAAAWLENDAELQPRPLPELLDETEATIARYAGDADAAAKALRTARRREVLRLSLAAMVGLVSVEDLGVALSDVTTAILTGALRLARRGSDELEFGIIAMGRYGGAELGFGSDADIMYVYRGTSGDADAAQKRAEQIVHEIKRLTDDVRLPLDLDLGLRPEGKNGAIVRSLESYRAYYARWSLTWEAQALLRARGVAGDEALLADFTTMADDVRYPASIGPDAVREVKRIKARVESERLPQGADPARHLKLGRGSLSDVEWLVQLWQLEHAHEVPALRTTSTLRALAAAVDTGLVTEPDAERLRAAWLIASRARSAMTLWTAKTADVLPTDRRALEGVARLMEYPPHSASRLDEDYLRTTRRARQVFERLFYGSRL
jgi:glutamate-ammonia-ligase adenylyltransferase